MKKIIVSCVTAGLILVGGGQAFAMEEGKTAPQTPNLGQMIVSHENMSVKEIKDMYLGHHGTLGAFSSANFEMNNNCEK